MPLTLLLIPSTTGVGLNVVGQGLKRTIDHLAIKVGFYKPISLHQENANHEGTLGATLSIKTVAQIVGDNKVNRLLEDIVGHYEYHAKETDIMVVQGINDVKNYPFAQELNYAIAHALDAHIIFVAAPETQDPDLFLKQIQLAIQPFQEYKKIVGMIINKINGPYDPENFAILDVDAVQASTQSQKMIDQLVKAHFHILGKLPLLGAIPWEKELLSPRVSDIAERIEAEIISFGDADKRRVHYISLCARNVSNVLNALRPGALIITPADRSDIIIATSLAALSGVHIAALLLTGEISLDPLVKQLCDPAFSSGLPVLHVPLTSFRTALKLRNLYFEIPKDDVERQEKTYEFIASHIKKDWIQELLDFPIKHHLSPPAFRYKIVEAARQLHHTILLPEGNNNRILAAAAICAQRQITHIVLLAKPEEVTRLAKNYGITLSGDIRVIDPNTLRHRYVNELVRLRQHKGVTPPIAKELLADDMYLATMMLYNNEIDGIVSGAVHTTAHTIRPALQIIKTQKNSSIVSSIFFMCFRDQVLVFGDCAINPDPTATQLAEIAIQSADTATNFGIIPKIAMISYSTGNSASGADVSKVIKATALVKQQRPDLPIDGPLQYDAALIDNIAKQKAPHSSVAGQANVLIFPDLNTGNTTYKAVQRSANILSLGPILQGLNKPVNDLSRGASIEDIVYTIAITAVQGGKSIES